eukprot:8052811-Lingulodinium_polyedra.AAC.1
MMRLNRRFAAAPARKSHANALHARTEKSVRAWTALARDLQAVAAARHRLNRAIAQVSNAAQ